ncbi:MAG: hypothetical protein ACE5SW_11855 [Nitrososphaeraceae archaeon]
MIRYNNFPLREWHIEHMKKTIIKFITGLSDNPTRWEVKQNKRYNNIFSVKRILERDVKQGVTNSEIKIFLRTINSDSYFIDLRQKEGFRERFSKIENWMIKHE